MTPLTRKIPFTRALALPAGLLLAGGLLAVSLPAASSMADTSPTLCKQQTAKVDSHAYTVENNEWGSSEPECISTDGGTGFSVANSAIANSTYGAPGGYTAIYKGCHWGACTPGSGFPIQVSDIHPGKVTTSWNTAQPGGSNDYDVAYDIWFNQTASTKTQPNGTELMIWLNHHGPVQPFGKKVAKNVSVGGHGYDVWYGNQGWNTVSYTMTSGTTSVSNLDLQPVIADAVSRGWISPSWYLIDVEAGFEMWHGGQGLATKSFGVKVAGAPSASLAETKPNSPPATAPSAASASSATPSSSASASSASASASSASPSSSATESPMAPTSSPSASSSPLAPAPSASSSPLAPAPSASSSPLAPSSAPDISLQGISPNSPAPGTSTNVTIDFRNNGSTGTSNLTLVTEVLNSAGNVVGSESQTGQNVASGETQNLSYAWTAASAGTYTIQGLVKDSSGNTVEQAKVGTFTVQ